jgi:hypothetical protein
MIASLVLMSFVEGPAISTVEHSMKGPLIEKVGHTRHLSSTIGIRGTLDERAIDRKGRTY